MKIKRAMLSVSDKTGIMKLAAALTALDVEILSTGGTAAALTKNGFKVTEVSDYTGSPEVLGGRVKSLHPKVHSGILNIRDDQAHQSDMAKQGWGNIDLVAVNLYPFEETINKPGVTFADAIENIDIGGPCMLRAAAKNCAFVAAICDPADYSLIIPELMTSGGSLCFETRLRLARKAFALTARYDRMITEYLAALK